MLRSREGLPGSPRDGALAIKGARRGIATRTSAFEGRAAPIQIRAQVLRERQDLAPPGALPGLAMMPEDAAPPSAQESPRLGQWRQADVKRAIAAAEQAGLANYRIEIAPDGTISIVVGPAEG